MRTTIDSAGRVVIPKPVREEAGLQAGAELEIGFRDGRIEIEPVIVAMRVVDVAGDVAIESEVAMPSLTSADVRAVLDQLRP